MRNICIVESLSMAPKLLGCLIDGVATHTRVQSTQEALEHLNVLAAKITLQRLCLNVSKAGHLLRCDVGRVA